MTDIQIFGPAHTGVLAPAVFERIESDRQKRALLRAAFRAAFHASELAGGKMVMPAADMRDADATEARIRAWLGDRGYRLEA